MQKVLVANLARSQSGSSAPRASSVRLGAKPTVLDPVTGEAGFAFVDHLRSLGAHTTGAVVASAPTPAELTAARMVLSEAEPADTGWRRCRGRPRPVRSQRRGARDPPGEGLVSRG
jgi:hypothetical protein